jgi:hypothetical protein
LFSSSLSPHPFPSPPLTAPVSHRRTPSQARPHAAGS